MDKDYIFAAELFEAYIPTFTNKFSVVSSKKTLLNKILKLKINDDQKNFSIYIKTPLSKEKHATLFTEFSNIEKFNNFLNSSEKKFKCVEVIKYIKGPPEAIILKESQGESFFQIIKDSSHRLSFGDFSRSLNAAKISGECIKFIESHTCGKESIHWVKDEICGQVEEVAKKILILNKFPFMRESVKECLEIIKNSNFAENESYLSHGDFHPENLFIDVDSVTLIDFGISRPQFIGYDAIYFEHYLNNFDRIRYKPKNLKMIYEAFWAGYERKLSPALLKANKAQIFLNDLVYLSTKNGILPFQKIMYFFDVLKAKAWLVR